MKRERERERARERARVRGRDLEKIFFIPKAIGKADIEV